MFNANKPDAAELPSSAQLLKSTGIAAAVAGVLLVTVVMPAEYGVDPTGAGSVLGLTEMGRIKMSLAAEAASEAEIAEDAPAVPEPEAAAPEPVAETPAPVAPPPAAGTAPAAPAAPVIAAPPQKTAAASDKNVFTIEPDEGFEIKLVMKKGAKATFVWFTDGPGVNYDTHGDGRGVNYHGYGKGTNVDRQEGELVAAFDGSHGWFWRNRTEEAVTITLETRGDYSELKVID